MTGQEGNRFVPQASATRAEVAVMLRAYRTMGATETPETPAEESHVLVAYFSATGNTEGIAQHLQSILDADLYEIVPENPYTSADLDYGNSNSRTTQEQNNPSARPAISGTVENMEQYDTVLLGYPIWHGQAPRIISTFLESYDWDGKTLVPFNTSASGGFGRSLSGLEESASGATILDGLSMTNLTINNKARTIEMTKKFEKAASCFDSDKYKALQEASKNYPAYRLLSRPAPPRVNIQAVKAARVMCTV